MLTCSRQGEKYLGVIHPESLTSYDFNFNLANNINYVNNYHLLHEKCLNSIKKKKIKQKSLQKLTGNEKHQSFINTELRFLGDILQHATEVQFIKMQVSENKHCHIWKVNSPNTKSSISVTSAFEVC